MSESLALLLRRDRWLIATSLLIIIGLAWWWLLVGAGMHMTAADMTRMVYGDHSVMQAGMHMSSEWDLAYWLLMFCMWWVMMIAMMLPSAAPLILLAAMIGRKAAPQRSPYGPTHLFLLGYLLVWGGFSLLATVAQWWLQQIGLLSGMTMASSNRWLGGVLLLAAAVWQFTPLKRACLRHCRSPVDFLVARRGRGALWMGFEHGCWCVGCCWFLMTLLFVGGVMNLFWIFSLSVVVLTEKLLRAGPLAGRLLGVVLALAGAAMLAGLF